ncbi:hypothetical protein TCSYLVIO_000651, partial [Trypanosoma cruzi]
MVLKRLLWVWT